MLLIPLVGCFPRAIDTKSGPANAPVAQRMEAHGFPRIANQLQVPAVANDVDLYGQLDWWDVVILEAEVIESNPGYLGPVGRIRSASPNTIILTYFSGGDVNRTYDQPLNREYREGLKPEWMVHDVNGEEVDLFELSSGRWTQLLNPTSAANRYLPEFLAANVMSTRLSDGIFYDWATTSISWLNHREGTVQGRIDIDGDGEGEADDRLDEEWTAGYQRMLQNSIELLPPGTILVGNAGWNTGTAYQHVLNGVMIEGFLDGENINGESYGWTAIMRTYASYQMRARKPRLSIIMANSDDADATVFQRFALASALMFDGYFAFTNRSSPGPAYQTARWYDEYSVDFQTGAAVRDRAAKGYLGRATGHAYNVANHAERLSGRLLSGETAEDSVWRRDFEMGIVLVNPTNSAHRVGLGDTFRKINGDRDSLFNDGSEISSIALEPMSGVVLLNR